MSDTDALSERLAACYASVVHDVMRAMGLSDFTLPPRLRPLMPERRLAGPAFTILGKVDPTADPHETLLAWTGLLSRCPPGRVWCCQPNDSTVAHMGELSAETLHEKGVRGAVADGMIRDSDFLIALGFQTWGTGFTPRDVVGWWLPAAVDVPIRIGEVSIVPGDFLLGDRDGMVRIPRDRIEEVLEKAEAAMTAESAVRTAIRAGTDPQEAYLKHGKF
jgi:regulator of RNase E activity RraA